MYCHRCGGAVPDDARFCPRCGTELVDPATLGLSDDAALAEEPAAEEALWGSGASNSKESESAVEPSPQATTVVEAQGTASMPSSDPTIVVETEETSSRTEVYDVPVQNSQPQAEPQPQPSNRPQPPTSQPRYASYDYQSAGPAPSPSPSPIAYPRTAGAIVVTVLALVLIAVSLCPWVAIPQGLAQLAGGAQQFLNDLGLGSLGGDLSGSLNGYGLDFDFDFSDLGIDLGGLGLGALNLAGGYAPWSLYGLASLLDTITESAVMIPGAVGIVGCWIAAVVCLVIGVIGCLMPGGSGFARASALAPIGSALMAIDAVGTWLYALYADGLASVVIGDWLAELSTGLSADLDIDSGLGEILLGGGAPINLTISLLNVTFWLWVAVILAVVTFVLGIAFRRRREA